jgi:hypothetical protein
MVSFGLSNGSNRAYIEGQRKEKLSASNESRGILYHVSDIATHFDAAFYPLSFSGTL